MKYKGSMNTILNKNKSELGETEKNKNDFE